MGDAFQGGGGAVLAVAAQRGFAFRSSRGGWQMVGNAQHGRQYLLTAVFFEASIVARVCLESRAAVILPEVRSNRPFIVPVWYAPANNTGVIEVTGTTAHTATLVNPPAPSDFTSTIAGSRHYSTGTNRGTTARTVF